MRTPEQNKHNQQSCKRCGRIVGCDYRGRKHKCGCVQESTFECSSPEHYQEYLRSRKPFKESLLTYEQFIESVTVD